MNIDNCLISLHSLSVMKTVNENFLFSHFSDNKAECCGKVEEEKLFLQGEKGYTHHHGHPGCFRCHMDTVQRDGPDQHFLFRLHPKLPLDHRLLALLHQQHRQPSLLRPVQPHLQKHFQAPPSVPVQEHTYGTMRLKILTRVSDDKMKNIKVNI